MTGAPWEGRLKDRVHELIGEPPPDEPVAGHPEPPPFEPIVTREIFEQALRDELAKNSLFLQVPLPIEEVMSGSVGKELAAAAVLIEPMLLDDDGCQHVIVPDWWFRLSRFLFAPKPPPRRCL